MKLPAEGPYFNSGVMLMDLDELRKHDFFQRAVEFLSSWTRHYRFWDQSAINFLLHGQIDTLPEYWNRASWRFDAQQNNDLDCVLHYTTCAPWLGGARTPSQVLFERFAEEAALPVSRQSSGFKRSIRRNFWRNRSRHCEHLLFQSDLSSMELPGKRRSRLLTRKSRVTGWITFVMRGLGGSSITGEVRRSSK